MRQEILAVIFGLLIVGSLSVGYFAGSQMNVKTTIITSTQTIKASSQTLYELTFHQNVLCHYASLNGTYIAPWSVTLNGLTISQPANASLSYESKDNTLSSIVFTLPSGTYQYTINPSNVLAPTSGAVIVNGNDTVVQIHQELSSCGSSSISTG